MQFARARQSSGKDGGIDGGAVDSTVETERWSRGIATGCTVRRLVA